MLKELRHHIKIAQEATIDNSSTEAPVWGGWTGGGQFGGYRAPLTTEGYTYLYNTDPTAFMDTLYKYDPHRSPLEDRFGEIMNVTPPDTTLTPAGIMTTPADTTYTRGLLPAAPRAYNWVGGGEEAWNPSLFEAMSLLFDNGRLRPFEGMYDRWRDIYGEPEALFPFPGNLPPLSEEGR